MGLATNDPIKSVAACSVPSREEKAPRGGVLFTVEVFEKRNKFVALMSRAIMRKLKNFALTS
jgi:hypothetical protein